MGTTWRVNEWFETASPTKTLSVKIMTTKYRDVHESEWNWAGSRLLIDNNGTLQDLNNK